MELKDPINLRYDTVTFLMFYLFLSTLNRNKNKNIIYKMKIFSSKHTCTYPTKNIQNKMEKYKENLTSRTYTINDPYVQELKIIIIIVHIPMRKGMRIQFQVRKSKSQHNISYNVKMSFCLQFTLYLICQLLCNALYDFLFIQLEFQSKIQLRTGTVYLQ